MKLLLTGGSGFIGSRALRLLMAQGVDVVTLGRSRPDVDGNFGFVGADLLDPAGFAEVIDQERPTHLLHLAWNATPGKFWNAADNLDWCASSLRLLRQFYERGGHRAVFAGSCAEYQWTGEAKLSEQSTPLAPATLYGVAKDSLRHLACAYADQAGHSFAWGRVFWLYGPGEPGGRLVSDVAVALLAKQTVDVSAGLQQRDFLHVDDVAGAFVQALHSTHQGPFNIASGHPVPVRHIVSTLADLTGARELVNFGARASPPDEPPQLFGDVATLLDRIGYRPIIDLEHGLRMTVEWHRQRSAFCSDMMDKA